MIAGGYTYIMTNKANTVLYIGVTACLERRVHEHKQLLTAGFTAKYRITKLVYYERHENIEDAIKREKYLKGKTRAKKVTLISISNPNWEDLSCAVRSRSFPGRHIDPKRS